jgi:hypothetical protein
MWLHVFLQEAPSIADLFLWQRGLTVLSCWHNIPTMKAKLIRYDKGSEGNNLAFLHPDFTIFSTESYDKILFEIASIVNLWDAGELKARSYGRIIWKCF